MPTLPSPKPVTTTPAASAAEVLAHFTRALALETDCWDVHASLATGDPGFVLLDVRTQELYARAHLPGARSLPHARISERALAGDPPDTLYVVYCAGAHCNGADKAAVKLASMGRRVKKMVGGIVGWREEGFAFEAAR